MDASLFIAGRLRFKGKMAMISVAVSFLVMIIAVSVSSGFRREIRSGLSMLSGDVQIMPVTMNLLDENSPIEKDASYVPYIKEVPGVKEIIPVAYRAGIIKNGQDIHGVLFKGTADGVASADSVSLPVSIPSRLSEIAGLKSGDRMLAYFVGDNVKARQFNIVSVYDAMVETDDRLVVYADIADIQRINGWGEDQVSSIEVLLEPEAGSRGSLEDIGNEIGFLTNSYTTEDETSVVAVSSVSRYPQLFDWLQLITLVLPWRLCWFLLALYVQLFILCASMSFDGPQIGSA